MISQRTKSQVKKLYGIYIAEVKSLEDAAGFGRMQVFVNDITTATKTGRDDPSNWTTILYSSPFFGSTNIADLTKAETYEGTQTSYGMWMPPADVGTLVLVSFANGDIGNGFYMGSYPQSYADRMVPGFAAGKAHTNAGKGDKIQIPVPQAETNRLLENDLHPAVTKKTDQDSLRPYAKYHTEGLITQGLIDDDVRGTTTASARRDAPANCYGINTPGPKIANGKRKGGSSFVMDDDEESENVRIRTRSGSQMLLDETNGLVYFINRDGTSWVEMDADGNVDIFSAKSITMRAEEDFNIRADRNITMEAGQNIYMKAAKDYGETGKHHLGEEGGSGGNIYLEARNDALILVKNNTHLTNEVGNLDVNIKTGNITVNAKGTTDVKSTGAMKIDAATIALKSTNINVESGGNTQVSGTMTSDGNMYAPNFQAPGIGLVGHIHPQNNGNDLGGGVPTNAGFVDGGSGSASGPVAATAAEVVKEAMETKINVEERDLGLPNVKSAIDKLLGKVREQDVTSLLKRWITREPCPEKKHKKD